MAQGGMSLPAGYTKIEYLESDGNSYIDTGYKPNSNTRVLMDFQLTDTSATAAAIFGGRSSYTVQDFSFWFYNGGWLTNFGTTSTSIQSDVTGRYVVDKNKLETKINGKSVNSITAAFQSPVNLFIFAVKEAAGIDERLGKMRVYSCQIYDNGALVRDFIPCTNPDGISGLWDSVNDVFYNMLSADYTKLDFIETDGTTYIDTGFNPNNNTRVVFKGYSNSSLSGWIFGSWASATSNQFAASCLATYSIRYGTENAQPAAVTVGDVNIDMNKNKYTYNGASGSLATQTFSSSYPIYLFAINDAGRVSSGKFYGKFYSCKIYDNGTLIRNFIPAMNASGEAGLYDLTNDVWYALLPAVKPKVGNKITVKYVYDYSNWTVDVFVDAQFSVTTRITVEALLTTYLTINGNTRPTVSNVTLYIETNKIRSNILNVPMGNIDPVLTITSISPTEDDTYIYTF